MHVILLMWFRWQSLLVNQTLIPRGKTKVDMSLVRILVVDDFCPWRGLILQQLSLFPDMRVVGVASDGLEAVVKAEEFQPDLVLLDIRLPTVNGIEAARQIRRLVPGAKILFLSSNADVDVVRVALDAGGHGYVLKWDAAAALMPGIEAVLRGEKFLSCGLAGFTESKE
jgi:DNA-binding NarL/FixJ family response regulator